MPAAVALHSNRPAPNVSVEMGLIPGISVENCFLSSILFDLDRIEDPDPPKGRYHPTSLGIEKVGVRRYLRLYPATIGSIARQVELSRIVLQRVEDCLEE